MNQSPELWFTNFKKKQFWSNNVQIKAIFKHDFLNFGSKSRDLFKQFLCPLHGTKNSILQLSFETQFSYIYFC